MGSRLLSEVSLLALFALIFHVERSARLGELREESFEERSHLARTTQDAVWRKQQGHVGVVFENAI